MVDDSSVARSKVARALLVTLTSCLMDARRGSLPPLDFAGAAAAGAEQHSEVLDDALD